MTKTELNKEFDIFHRLHWLVKTWNSKQPMPIGAKGWVDYILISPNNIYYIECKIGKDKLTEEQKEVKNYLEHIGAKYYEVTDKNYVDVFESIINGDRRRTC